MKYINYMLLVFTIILLSISLISAELNIKFEKDTYPFDQNVTIKTTSTGFVPYAGAINNVNLGIYDLTADWVFAKVNWSYIQNIPAGFQSKAGGSPYLYNDSSTIFFNDTFGNNTYVPYTGATKDVDIGANDYYGNATFFTGNMSISVDGDAEIVLDSATNDWSCLILQETDNLGMNFCYDGSGINRWLVRNNSGVEMFEIERVLGDARFYYSLTVDDNLTVDDYIIGDGSYITNLNLSGINGSFVPYTGATGNVDLGVNNITAYMGNFTDLYVSNSTLYIGNVSISANDSATKSLTIETGAELIATRFVGDGSQLTNISFVNGSATFNGSVTADSFVGGNFTGENFTIEQICNSTDCYNISDFLGVPYVGAIQNVELGNYNLSATTITALNLGNNTDHVNYSYVNHIEQPHYIQFNTTFTNGASEGKLRWDSDDGTLTVGMPGGNVNLQIGQENLIRATNDEGVQIDNCQIVYISGSTGVFPEIKLASNSPPKGAPPIGLATENITNAQKGYINTFGYVRECNTSAFAGGSNLFLGMNGELTNVPPPAPNSTIFIGNVIRSHGTEGVIFVKLDKLPAGLTDISNVNGSATKNNNSVLYWNNDTGVWSPTNNPIFDNNYIKKYATGNFNGSLYTTGANSTSSLSNSLFQVISDTRGTPQFFVQDGGPYQASFITRSFLVVNQNNTLLNSSQNNDCRDWGFVHLDCNTATTGADFGVTDDIEGQGIIYADEGLRAHSTEYGSYLVLGDRNKLYQGSNGEYNSTDNTFCDYTANNFVPGSTSQWLVINDENSEFDDARADVSVFISASCIELEHNPSWDKDFNASWQINDGLNLVAQSGGFFEYYVGDDEQSKFKIKINNGTSHTGFYVDDVPGADQHQAATIDMKMGNYEGMVGLNIFMGAGDEQIVDKSVTMLLMEAEASQMNSSDGVFIDMQMIGYPLTIDGHIDGIHMPSGMSHLIEVGSPETIGSAYSNDINITINVTGVGNDVEVFTLDNDVLYIGSDADFTTMTIALSTESSTNIAAIYYYCDDTFSWALLPGVTDTTDGLKVSGSISFSNPADRGNCSKELDGTPFSDTNNYTYIAIQRLRNNVVIPPIIDRLDISGGSTNMFMTEDLLRLHPVDTAPETCNAGNLGAIYYDISEDDMCVCRSWGWSLMIDGGECI